MVLRKLFIFPIFILMSIVPLPTCLPLHLQPISLSCDLCASSLDYVPTKFLGRFINTFRIPAVIDDTCPYSEVHGKDLCSQNVPCTTISFVHSNGATYTRRGCANMVFSKRMKSWANLTKEMIANQKEEYCQKIEVSEYNYTMCFCIKHMCNVQEGPTLHQRIAPLVTPTVAERVKTPVPQAVFDQSGVGSGCEHITLSIAFMCAVVLIRNLL